MALLDVRNPHFQARLHLSLIASNKQPLLHSTIDGKVVYCAKEGSEFCVEASASFIAATTKNNILLVTLSIDGENIGYSKSFSCDNNNARKVFEYVLREKGEFALAFKNASTSYTASTLHPNQAELGTIRATFKLYRVQPDTPPIYAPRSSTSVSSMKVVPENKKCCDRASLVAGDGRFLAPLESRTHVNHPLIYPALCSFSLTVHYHSAMVYNILTSRKHDAEEEEEEEESCEEVESDEDSVEILPPPPSPPRVIIDLTDDNIPSKRRQTSTRARPNQRRRRDTYV